VGPFFCVAVDPGGGDAEEFGEVWDGHVFAHAAAGSWV
jgi:hypothetical protein